MSELCPYTTVMVDWALKTNHLCICDTRIQIFLTSTSDLSVTIKISAIILTVLVPVQSAATLSGGFKVTCIQEFGECPARSQ